LAKAVQSTTGSPMRQRTALPGRAVAGDSSEVLACALEGLEGPWFKERQEKAADSVKVTKRPEERARVHRSRQNWS
jgi:hypothetical protein